MATVQDIMKADAEAMRDDLPTTFTFGATSYTGSLTDVRLENEMRGEGYLPMADAELTIILDDFGTPPVVNDYVTIAGVVYRVDERHNSPEGETARLMLKRKT